MKVNGIKIAKPAKERQGYKAKELSKKYKRLRDKAKYNYTA